MWWLLVYVCGYAAGVSYAVTVARRAYADRKSMLWDYHGEKVTADAAVMCGAAVLFVPLAWPLVGLGMAGWALVVRGVDNAPSRR